MALIDDFKAAFPEFDTAVVDATFPGVASVYGCYYGAEYAANGSCDDKAILQLCAHLFVLRTGAENGQTAPSKSVASQSVGSVSVSYNGGTFSDKSEFFNSTIYGQQFLMLTRSNQGAFFV